MNLKKHILIKVPETAPEIIKDMSRYSEEADVWATSISNRIRSHLDLEKSLRWCMKRKCIEGVVILVDDYLGAWGDIRLSRVE